MVRIFLPSVRATDARFAITGEKAHYLLTVLRCRKGDHLIIFDGSGTCFTAVIREARKQEVVAEILESSPCHLESPLYSILVQGILKGEKMDMVIQKTTELGVNEIVPVVTERSQLRDTRRVARWRKIAEEASRQSGRSVVPIVHEPVNLKDYLAVSSARATFPGFIFYEEEGMKLSEAVAEFALKSGKTTSHMENDGKRERELFILIGPEGGFTKEEVTYAEKRGLRVISLGKRVLRAETAAISAVTLIQYLLGDMG